MPFRSVWPGITHLSLLHIVIFSLIKDDIFSYKDYFGDYLKHALYSETIREQPCNKMQFLFTFLFFFQIPNFSSAHELMELTISVWSPDVSGPFINMRLCMPMFKYEVERGRFCSVLYCTVSNCLETVSINKREVGYSS